VTPSNASQALSAPPAAQGITFDPAHTHAAATPAATRPTASLPALQPVVIRFGRLGDMVMLTALLNALHRRFGRRCLVLAAGPWSRPLLDDHPDVEQVWSVPRHSPMGLSLVTWRALRAVRASRPGPVYVCEYQPRQVRRIRRLLALGGISPQRCLYITQELAGARGHWVERLVQFAALTPPGIPAASYPLPPPDSVTAPRLAVSQAEQAELEAWLRQHGWAGRRLILIQPGNFRTMSRRREQWAQNQADDKAWPQENWAALLRQVSAALPDALLILCGAPQEGPMLEEVRRSAASEQVVVAELPLRRLLALCQRAHSMISIDTGPAHAAAACGLPLLVMYGAESPGEWLPRSPSGSAVVALGGPPRSRRVDELSVAEVFAAWQAMVAGLPSRQA
jgi:heptosyltransferase-2/heptosyltransferase-3